MRPLELLVIYLLIGGGVALAMARSHHPGAAVALPFWPLFLPGLLAAVAPTSTPAAPASDPRIHAAIETLAQALRMWDGLPPTLDVNRCLASAKRGLEAIAGRVAELDRLLAVSPGAEVPAHPNSLSQLDAVRAQSRADLERGIAGIRDLTARVHLARFTGAIDGEVAGQLSALAAAVDGASEVRRLGAG